MKPTPLLAFVLAATMLSPAAQAGVFAKPAPAPVAAVPAPTPTAPTPAPTASPVTAPTVVAAPAKIKKPIIEDDDDTSVAANVTKAPVAKTKVSGAKKSAAPKAPVLVVSQKSLAYLKAAEAAFTAGSITK